VQLTYGVTKVALSDDFLGALGSLDVKPDNVLPGALYATDKGVSAAFPIPTGELDAGETKLEILHSGGLTLTAAGGTGTRVALTSFIIENIGADGRLQLTGVVKADDTIVGRIPLFDLELTEAPEVRSARYWKGSDKYKRDKDNKYGDRSPRLEIDNVNVTLAETAAAALNSVFGLNDVFKAGLPIGVAEVEARLRDLDR
jgi:hypothetical protein